MLVRGETLKQRALPYIMSCEVTNLPAYKIMFRHLLPNITAPILISFTFGVAGAILAESGFDIENQAVGHQKYLCFKRIAGCAKETESVLFSDTGC